MLKTLDIDAISVCVPTTFHAKTGTKILKYNINVLIEKPITNTVEEAEVLLRAIPKKCLLTVGFIERFNPTINCVKNLFDAYMLNKLTHVCMKRVGKCDRIKDVGVVKDLSVHDIDLARYLFESEPKSINGFFSKVKSSHKFEDYAQANLMFNNGSSFSLESSWINLMKERKILAFSEEYVIEADLIEKDVIFQNGNNESKHIIPSNEEPLTLELQHWINAVQGLESLKVTGEDGLKSLQICEKILNKP
jgi:UDP-N-acetylglucosamine 3-dehydrogenase